MAFVAVATSVGAAVGLTGTAAVLGGGALIGAGVGGLYSAVTGDGNILDSMLTGGLLGAGGAYGLQAMGVGQAAGTAGAKGAAAAVAPSTAAVPTANVMTATPAMQAAAQNAANLNAAAIAEGATTAGMVPAANTGLAANTVLPASMSFTAPAAQTAAGLTGGQKLALGLGGVGAVSLLGANRGPKLQPFQPGSAGQIRPYTYTSTPTMSTPYPNPYQYGPMGMTDLNTTERQYFDAGYTALPPYNAAQGGLMAAGGPVERMSAMDQQRGMYPMGMIDKTYYATPYQRPASMEVVRSDYDTPVNPITGLQPMGMAAGGALGSYSDGGRMLKGPGDGMSDDIPGIIGNKQPARLADGEFVVPADVVSHLGNGSTDAGAKRLYAMMDRVRKARTGTKKQGKQIKAEKFIPK